jgi:hypothetical protein
LGRGITLLLAYQSGPNPEDIKFHALLNERLLAVRRERASLWSRIRRFFLGDREDSEEGQ